MSASLSARLRGLLDRFANADIRPTAADVAGHRVIDVGIRRTRIARKERRRGHDLARLAVPALHDLPVEPRLLDFGARRCRSDCLDRCDLGSADAVDRGDAGTGGDAVDVHGAGAAQCHAAAELRAGHAEHVAQHPQEWDVAVDIDVVGGSVDFDGVGHGCLKGCWVLILQYSEISGLRVTEALPHAEPPTRATTIWSPSRRMRRTCCRSPMAKGTEISWDWPGRSTDEKRTTACFSASPFCSITGSTVVTTCQPSGSLTQ